MDRSRSFSRPSTGNRKPRSPSPPTTRGRATSRPRPVSFHPSTRGVSRSRSGVRRSSESSSRSSSYSPTRRHSHSHHRQHDSQHGSQHKSSHGQSHKSSHSQEHHHGLFKTSAGLIAGIGLATVLAHKVWPKGVLYGDTEEWESRPHPKHRHSDRHEHHHRHRRASDAERAIDRARRHGGDVVYYEEIGPFPGRRRSAALQSYERLSPAEEERIRRMSRDEHPRVGRLPYPDEPYPGESFYEPERRRHSVAQPVAVPR
ncbi:hypothetical protein FALCPG4_010606 [Fusarium falciforme]|uniref:Uncharacterized protein n=1 Tax=Fusarium falciforme TaxID=195108 RepID=A0A9W8RGM5_9HYPO|nr:hypothetical protein NW755_002479 [Fusarium falciforme]